MKKTANILAIAGAVLAAIGLLIWLIRGLFVGAAGFAQFVPAIRILMTVACAALFVVTYKVKGIWPEVAVMILDAAVIGVACWLLGFLQSYIVGRWELYEYINSPYGTFLFTSALRMAPVYLGQGLLMAAAGLRLGVKIAEKRAQAEELPEGEAAPEDGALPEA